MSNKWFLVSQITKFIKIALLDGSSLYVGRSSEFDIVDKSCSRKQVCLTPNYSRGCVQVVCTGGNPCSIGNKVLHRGQEDNLFPGQTLCLCSGKLPFQLLIEGEGVDHEDIKKEVNRGEEEDMAKRKTAIKRKAPIVEKNTTEKDTNSPPKSSAKRMKVNDIEDKLKDMQAVFENADKELSSQKDVGTARSHAVGPSHTSIVSTGGWSEIETCMIYGTPGLQNRPKVAAFDMDGTLITTQSGRVFPKDANDWRIWATEVPGKLKQLQKEGYKIVILSNQLGVSRGQITKAELKGKAEKICAKLGVPMQCLFATTDDQVRKPRTGMWTLLGKVNGGIPLDLAGSVYIGDAAGREANWEPKKKKDHSCVDRLFAMNLGVRFHTPEEFFLNHSVAGYKKPEFISQDYVTSVKGSSPIPDGLQMRSQKQEVVLLVGWPASGKSYFSKKHFAAHGYQYISRDVLSTWQKCVSGLETALPSNKSVVVDNTSLDLDSRSRFINVANNAGVPIRCFKMTTSITHSKHNEKFRQMMGDPHEKIKDMIFNMMKSKFVEPTVSEGFSEIVPVTLIPEFKTKEDEALYCQFLLER